MINTIQQGLAAELNFQAIVDLVGDKLCEVFATPDLSIIWYDEKTRLGHTLYSYEHGVRLLHEAAPLLPDGVYAKLSKTHQPLVWDTEEELYAITPVIPGTDASKSGAIIPIISSDRVIGAITVENYEQEHAFGEAQLRLLTTVAGSLGAALENAHLFEETQRLLAETEQRNNELAIINTIQQGLAAELDFQSIVDLVGEKLRQVFNVKDIGITWHDKNTNLIHLLYAYEHGQRINVEPLPPNPGGIFERMVENRQPVVFNTLADFQRINVPIVPGTDQSKSAVYVPIISSDRVLGDISLENFERENAYGEAEVRLLTTIAGSLGTALENARLFNETQRLLEETRQRNSELAILNSIQQGLASRLDFQSIVDLVGDKLRQVFNVNDIGIDWFDEKNTLLHGLYVYEHGKRLVLEPTLPKPGGIFETLVKQRQPIVFNTPADHGEINIALVPGTDQARSSVYVPIISSNRVLGIINLDNFERENAYGESEVRLLTTIAGSLGTALENARLFDETQRLLEETSQRSSELAILNSVSEEMAKTLDVKTITRIVGDKVHEIFETDAAFIFLLDAETNLIHCYYGFDKGEGGYVEDLVPFPIGTGLSSKVILSRQPLLLGTIEEQIANGAYYDEENLEQSSGVKTQSWLGVPIIVSDKVLGVVHLSDYRQNAYNQDHLRLLQTLASNMGVAIANARQFEAEAERVAELQVINTIQQGLAAELNFQAIIDLVGDKLREVFSAPDLAISLVR